MPLAAETEAEFFKTFGCHFSIRAVWNDIFKAHWNDDKVYYENATPGLWLIFRPEKVSDAAFKEFADKQLGEDKKKGLFDRLESVLQIDKNSAAESTYTQWASEEYSKKLVAGKAECFVGISLSEMRSIASAAAASRGVSLNIAPTPSHVPGNGFFQRGKLHIPLTLAPLTKLAATSGLSLHQAASYYLGDGCFKLEAAEKLSKKIESVLPDCDFAFRDGGTMNIRDKFNEIRSVDLFALSSQLNPEDELLFSLYSERLLRWDVAKKRFGPPPLDREISPIGLPAFVERRIRPAEHLIKHNAPTALFEPFFDSDGKRCDLCYTNECTSTVVFIDPQKPQFKDIPDVNAARRFYYADGGTLPLYIEALDVLRFPGGIPGLVECPAVILCGSDVSSLASEAERATALAMFADLPDVTQHVHFYAFSTNCAAVAPRKLTQDEQALLKSRVQSFLKSANTDPGLELNLYFDLPRAKPKGKVVRRKN